MVVKRTLETTVVPRMALLSRLTEVLTATQDRAQATGESLLACVAFDLEVQSDDVIRWWWSQRGAFAWLWREPQSSDLFAAVGRADSVDTAGVQRFVDMERAYYAARERVVAFDQAEVRWFCGFSFIPRGLAERLQGVSEQGETAWQNWPDAALVLPAYVVRMNAGRVQLTVNVPVASDSFDVDTAVHRIEAHLSQLLSPRAAQVVEDNRPEAAGFDTSGTGANGQQCDRGTWQGRVLDAAEQVRTGRLSKVVLARQQVLDVGWRTSQTETMVTALLTQFAESYRFAVWRDGSLFVGASPERLVRVQGERVELDCLAGTAARGTTVQSDEDHERWLLSSDKNLREHQVLVDWMRSTVDPLLMDVEIPRCPRIRKQSAVQHLHTPVTGWLRDGISIFDVLAAVHPTPAVAGVPREAALQYITRREGLDRGWYSGGVGWIDGDGDGELCVALRSALVLEAESLLFAGGGVMGDSDPEEEWQEAEYKLQPMKSVLSGLA